MRQVKFDGKNDLNNAITIEADDLGSGGASHFYTFVIQEPGKPSWTGGTVQFQNGPIKEAGLNGISNEALLAVVIDRLQCFMGGPFPSRETAIALTNLQQALMWLESRTAARVAQGVEGESKAHVS